MKVSLCTATFLVPFLLSTSIFATKMGSPSTSSTTYYHLKNSSTIGLWSESENEMENPMGNSKGEKVGSRRGRTLQIAGSRLPNCMHACGSCSPCRLVSISFACASVTEEAESCPISYRCMCNNKSYPIP